MKGFSLFSGAGIGETYLIDCGIEILTANELVERRANLYQELYPNCNMICGDITDPSIFNQIIDSAKGSDFLIASPPCQGMSVAGKNRHQNAMVDDPRNYLINWVFDAISIVKPRFILIENVPMLLKIKLPYKNELHTVEEILNLKFSQDYNIESRVVDAADYGVPQTRLRAIIKLYPRNHDWPWPTKVDHKMTVREAIGDLPSLEAGEASDIPWHYARPHDPRHVLWMKHTPTGKSAFSNPQYYPQRLDGSRIKGYESSYRRIKWDEPSPTITIRNDAISSQRNVHPGRLLPDGTYSDARVLTPYELMILTSLPKDWPIPSDTPEILIRQVIGEAIPPLMVKRIVNEIDKIKTVSLFSSAGIGELRLPRSIEVVVANELLERRADCYSFFYPDTKMICGSITDKDIKTKIIKIAKDEGCKFLIATPPCQGLSTLGKNKVQDQYEIDQRNFLIFDVFEVINSCDFDYILIENVPKFLEMYFPYKGEYKHLVEILNEEYNDQYNVDARVLNAKDYGICQSRPRAITKMWKKGLKWPWPLPEPEIPLKDAIGHLPSLEPGEDSGIPWHYAKPENPRTVLAMRHTPPGKSAIANEEFYPKKEDGSRIKGFHNTFKRMVWDQPCPARTTYCGSMSSHNNVHPGHLLEDGTYSDPRVLTLLETFIVSSIPEDIRFPKNTTDTFIRTVIGEAIPPHLMEKIVEQIGGEPDANNG